MCDVNKVDVVVGLAWGDEGKGKVVSDMLRLSNNSYDYVCRFNGGPNAGHTIYKQGKKYKTHLVPAGIFHNIPSYIGPGCVVNIKKLKEEFDYLKSNGFNTDLVKVHPNAHIITDEHIVYDKEHLGHLGTTGQGIAPAYADKMLRKGIRAKDELPSDMLWPGDLSGNILAEGAQSIWLDPDLGDYPYVTSSSTLPYYACSLGFPAKKIYSVIGVAKAYDTKSGVDPLFPSSLFDDPILAKIGELGAEFGTTTGRRRAVNYLNVSKLIKAAQLSGTTSLVINKIDVLDQLANLGIGDPYKVIYGGTTIKTGMFKKDLSNRNNFIQWIREALYDEADFHDHQITFSSHPEFVITPNKCECGADLEKDYCDNCKIDIDCTFIGET
jgi:adenylosuccinate synthase